MTRTACPHCKGVCFVMLNGGLFVRCPRCDGLGWIDAAETSLSGDASEIDVQQTPADRERIRLAYKQMERQHRRERRVATAWAWVCVAACLVTLGAAIALVALACGWRP